MDNINSSIVGKNLVTNSLEYYDKNQYKYENFINKIRYIKFEISKKDMEHNIIHLYDNNKKKIHSSRYEIISIYTNQYKLWAWAWSIPIFQKNTTYIAKKIVNYGMNLNSDEAIYLKTELINSRFKISNPIQLDIHTAIASYLSKKPLIYKYIVYKSFKKDEDNIFDIKYIPEDDSENYRIYYMILLDYNNL